MTRTDGSPNDASDGPPTGPWHRLAWYRDSLDAATDLAAQVAATLRAARV